MRKTLVLTTLALITSFAFANNGNGNGHGHGIGNGNGNPHNGDWDKRGENFFIKNQKPVCGIKVVDDTAKLASNVNGSEAQVRDFTKNYIFNNSQGVGETVIKIKYNFDDVKSYKELKKRNIQLVIKDQEAGLVTLPYGTNRYTMRMEDNVQSFKVGMRLKNGTLLDAGESTVKLTYTLICR